LSKGQSPICKKYPAVARKKLYVLEKEARVLALIYGALISLCARRLATLSGVATRVLALNCGLVWCTIGKEVWQGY
jgi:hypothetical protein